MTKMPTSLQAALDLNFPFWIHPEAGEITKAFSLSEDPVRKELFKRSLALEMPPEMSWVDGVAKCKFLFYILDSICFTTSS